MQLSKLLILAVACIGSMFATGSSGARMTGRVEALPLLGTLGTWTVSGRSVQVTALTEIDGQGSSPVVGSCVDVEGTAVSSTAMTASRIELRAASKCASDTSYPGTIGLFGSVEALPADGLIGVWTVAGTRVRVTAETKLKQDGGPVALGSCAEVKGTQGTDNSITALRVSIESGSGGCSVEGKKQQIEFQGTIQATAATGSNQWQISGRTVVINDATVIQPNNRPLGAGLCTMVAGRLESDNTVTASRVQVVGSGVCRNSNEGQAALHFSGLLTTVPAGGGTGSWMVGGILVNAGAQTRFEGGPFVTGNCVEVRGDYAANNLNATKIEGKALSYCNAGAASVRVEGVVEDMAAAGAAGSWKLSGRTVITDANTRFDNSRGTLLLGSCARATGTVEADGTVRASKVEVLATSGACIVAGGIVGAGNLSGTGVAPGQIISVFGRNIGPGTTLPMLIVNNRVSSRLANTRVLFDGAEASLIFASGGQINAIVPCSVAGKSQVQVQVESNGAWSNAVTIPVQAAAPSIFTLSNSGVGPAAVLNFKGQQGYAVNGSNDAMGRGETGVLFATGEGQTTPACQDGAITSLLGPFPTPNLPVSVEVGGKAATVVYAGSAPGLVRGALQVNFTLAADTPTGTNVPITLKVGEVVSQTGVTIAVK